MFARACSTVVGAEPPIGVANVEQIVAIGGIVDASRDDVGHRVKRIPRRGVAAVGPIVQDLTDCAGLRIGHVGGHRDRVEHAVGVAADLTTIDELGERRPHRHRGQFVDENTVILRQVADRPGQHRLALFGKNVEDRFRGTAGEKPVLDLEVPHLVGGAAACELLEGPAG